LQFDLTPESKERWLSFLKECEKNEKYSQYLKLGKEKPEDTD
jgi:hypothetical protein